MLDTQEEFVPPPIRDEELDVGWEFVRNSKAHSKFIPTDPEPKLDRYLLRAICKGVSKLRKEDSNLPMLVGSVVRKYVPDKDKKSRALANAYKSAVMAIYRSRKKWVKKRRASKPVKNPLEGYQERLI